MTDKPTLNNKFLASLVEKLDASQVPDPSLDSQIFVLDLARSRAGELTISNLKIGAKPAYTASVDAAYTFVERIMGGPTEALFVFSRSQGRMGQIGYHPEHPVLPQMARHLLAEMVERLDKMQMDWVHDLGETYL